MLRKLLTTAFLAFLATLATLATALLAALTAPAFAAEPSAHGTPIYFTAAPAGTAVASNAIRPAADLAHQALAAPDEQPIYFYAHGGPAAAAGQQQLAATPGGSRIPTPGQPIYFRTNKS